MASSDKARKPFDLLIWGASGFTGRLATRYLAQNAPADLAWAIGGRNESKLRAIASEARSLNPSTCREIGIIVGDADSAARCARVIISTAGPFYLYGEPLIRACIEHGCDYCDITGETLWVDSMIRKYQPQPSSPFFHYFLSRIPGTNRVPGKTERFWSPCADSTRSQLTSGPSLWLLKRASGMRPGFPSSKLLLSRKEASAVELSRPGSQSQVLLAVAR